ncbi:unnamed protein product [Lathyrus sativus]|nr:unnamed protein product [Lathyrus sativus]
MLSICGIDGTETEY